MERGEVDMFEEEELRYMEGGRSTPFQKIKKKVAKVGKGGGHKTYCQK